MEIFRKQAFKTRKDRRIKTPYKEILHKQAYEIRNDQYIKASYKEIFHKRHGKRIGGFERRIQENKVEESALKRGGLLEVHLYQFKTNVL